MVSKDNRVWAAVDTLLHLLSPDERERERCSHQVRERDVSPDDREKERDALTK